MGITIHGNNFPLFHIQRYYTRVQHDKKIEFCEKEASYAPFYPCNYPSSS